MKTAIICKSHRPDFDWLKYSARSIRKFASGFSEIVLVLPEGETFDWPEARIVNVRETPPGYLFQQAVKLYADTLTDADFILHWDSDCVFTRPVSPSDFIRDGKVVWGHKEFREDERRVWAPVIAKWMKEPATRSFMSGHPFTFPRWLFDAMREFCRTTHRQELSDYVMAQASATNMCSFSEFNCAGAYAYKFHRDKFVWENRDHEPPDGIWVHQGFTHGGDERKAQDIAEFERILSASPTLELSQEYYDKVIEHKLEQSVAIVQDVKYHVAALAEMAKKDGLAKGRIALALKRAGLVKK